MRGRSGLVLILAILLVFCERAGLADEPVTILMPHSVQIKYVTDRRQINHVVAQFKDQLLRSGSNASIVGCGNVTALIEQGVTDISFGAVCTVQDGNNRFTVLMCDDTQVRKFTYGGSGSQTREDVVRFIKKNCPPAAK